MSAARMRLRMTGIRLVAWGLRNVPKITNYLANKSAKFAAPAVKKIINREYRFGQTRFEASIYNYVMYPTPEQKSQRDTAIQEGVQLFWNELHPHLPTKADACLTLRPLFTDAAPPELSNRKLEIEKFIDIKISELGRTAHGHSIVNRLFGASWPKDVDIAFSNSNLTKWFEYALQSRVNDYRGGKHPWQFWDPEMAKNLPPDFYDAFWR